MALFSRISKALFGDPGKDIRRASDEQLGFQQRGLDYQIEANQPLLDMRNRILPGLEGFYSGDANAQNQLIDTVQSSPLYSRLLKAGQEGVGDRNQALGMSRSGSGAIDMGNVGVNLLDKMVNQRLQGQSRLAGMPVDTNAVTNQLNQMGQNVGSAGMGIANANQAGLGNLLSSGVAIAGMFSDELLKSDIKRVGTENGFNTYSWIWNDIANKLFGLSGRASGVIAQEVEKTMPEAIKKFQGYKTVDYKMIGVCYAG